MIIDTKSKEQLIDVLKEAGARFKGDSCNCPFHHDKHPSSGVYLSKNDTWRFKCQVCDYNLDVVGVIAQLGGQRPEDILKEQFSAIYDED